MLQDMIKSYQMMLQYDLRTVTATYGPMQCGMFAKEKIEKGSKIHLNGFVAAFAEKETLKRLRDTKHMECGIL